MYCFGGFGLLVEWFAVLDWLLRMVRGFVFVGWCCVGVLLLERAAVYV